MDHFQQYKLNDLLGRGYDKQTALNALNICDWDLPQAKTYLLSQPGARNEQDELSRAIEMSKSQDGIQNYQRANELQFLADLEPCTLEDRARIGNTPVGLKNIGNT